MHPTPRLRLRPRPAAVLSGLLLLLPAVDTGRAQTPEPPSATADVTPTPPAEVAPGFVDVRGDAVALPGARRLGADELRRLPRAEVRVADHRDPAREIVFTGVPLLEVLRACGLKLDAGMATIREAVGMFVLVEAADGYRAVFALAELDPALTDRAVLLADTRDGQPLGANEGPWRTVVPGDKRPARAVRQVTAVTVRKATRGD